MLPLLTRASLVAPARGAGAAARCGVRPGTLQGPEGDWGGLYAAAPGRTAHAARGAAASWRSHRLLGRIP